MTDQLFEVLAVLKVSAGSMSSFIVGILMADHGVRVLVRNADTYGDDFTSYAGKPPVEGERGDRRMNTAVEKPLKDKVVVITGASRGIGKQTALSLARRGADVVVVARTVQERESTPGTLNDTADELRKLGADPLVIPADLSLQRDLDRVVSATLERHGGVDILINNAAYTVGKALWAHVPDLSREQWEKGFAINVTAPLMLITAFWRSMCERGGGLVLNVTSPASNMQALDQSIRLEGSALPENGPLYGASKAALNRMANVIARDGAPYNIAIVNVGPGHVLTETMDLTFRNQGVSGAETGAISTAVPAAALAYLRTCGDQMQYSGQVVSAPELVAQLGLTSLFHVTSGAGFPVAFGEGSAIWGGRGR